MRCVAISKEASSIVKIAATHPTGQPLSLAILNAFWVLAHTLLEPCKTLKKLVLARPRTVAFGVSIWVWFVFGVSPELRCI